MVLLPGQKPIDTSQYVTSANSGDSLKGDDVTFLDAVGNFVTGNVDYQRQIESAMRAEAHSALEAAKARDFSRTEAERSRLWSERMSDTAYSRAIADLKRNGVNPYAIGLFGPASTPTASTATAYMGQSYVGNAPQSAQGVRELLGFIETAYKESKQDSRLLLDNGIEILTKLFDIGGSNTKTKTKK